MRILALLAQPLLIPDQSWKEVTMDFIEGLPKSGGRSTILVVVDRLTKFANFLSLTHPFTAKTVPAVLIESVYKLYGLPRVIISDTDGLFTSEFWGEFWACRVPSCISVLLTTPNLMDNQSW